MIICTIRNRICGIKNLAYCTIKINQPIRSESKVAPRHPDYQLVYKFPLVRIASIVNRLKLYQTCAAGVGISATTILAASDIIATEIATISALSGILWCFAFYVIGFLGQNRVGYIYLKNDQKSVKISYADFWGRRVDTDVDINDIWPLSDLPTSAITPLYYSLRRYSTKKTLKFNIKYATIVDPQKFQLVLGDPFLALKR